MLPIFVCLQCHFFHVFFEIFFIYLFLLIFLWFGFTQYSISYFINFPVRYSSLFILFFVLVLFFTSLVEGSDHFQFLLLFKFTSWEFFQNSWMVYLCISSCLNIVFIIARMFSLLKYISLCQFSFLVISSSCFLPLRDLKWRNMQAWNKSNAQKPSSFHWPSSWRGYLGYPHLTLRQYMKIRSCVWMRMSLSLMTLHFFLKTFHKCVCI